MNVLFKIIMWFIIIIVMGSIMSSYDANLNTESKTVAA